MGPPLPKIYYRLDRSLVSPRRAGLLFWAIEAYVLENSYNFAIISRILTKGWRGKDDVKAVSFIGGSPYGYPGGGR